MDGGPLIHGDQATWLIELRKARPLAGRARVRAIDLIHANHYFTLPLAERIARRGARAIIVETQDIQARQYVFA